MKVKSQAKINLFLHILGKRKDNYHLLESIFYFPDIYDTIEIIEGKKENKLEVDGRFADKLKGHENNNLILKTYSLLKILYATKIPDLHFKLTKNLPVASGIGGGSANAAVVLKALNEKYELGLSPAALYKIGARLGADVPACILGNTCFVEGIGEKLSDIPEFPELHILLVNPLVPVSTADIFRMGFGTYSEKLKANLSFKTTQNVIDFLEQTKNDMQGNAEKICPQINDIIKTISAKNGCLLARMSGSGATCFGIFETRDKAAQAKLDIEKAHPNYWCAVG